MNHGALHRTPFLISAATLFIALAPGIPYGYYQALRWLVCTTSCYGAVMLPSTRGNWRKWSLVVIAVVFNPLAPMYLGRHVWQVVDVVAGVVMASVMLSLGTGRRVDDERGLPEQPGGFSTEVMIGPLTKKVLGGSVDCSRYHFLASQAWAGDFEEIIGFLNAQGVLDRFLPRLRARERPGAIAEARTGMILSRIGFHICRWGPLEVPGHPGDLEIRWQEGESVFVEVKRPGWEGELSETERQTNRQDLPKHINAEVRSVAPHERVMFAVQKAMPKLARHRANLVAVVDDLFVSPLDLGSNTTAAISYRLADPQYRLVGGVFLLNPVCYDEVVLYRWDLVTNPDAEHPLPAATCKRLARDNCDPLRHRAMPKR